VIQINDIQDAVDFNHINRILVIKLHLLGDVLLTTPLYSALKSQYPHIKTDVLVYQETHALLEYNPDINEIYTIDRSWKKKGLSFQLKNEISLLKKLNSNTYDLIINLTDRWRGGWITRLLQPRYSVSKSYAHKRGKLWRKLFTHIYAVPKQNRHVVEENLDAIRRLGINLLNTDKKLKLVIPTQVIEDIDKLWQKLDLAHKRIISIHPTSRWAYKTWNPSHFAQVIDILNNNNHTVILLSGPHKTEIEYCDEILSKTNSSVINLAGKLSILECAALIQKTAAFIGLDSVAMHMSAAVETPTVAIFGPTKEQNWHPWQIRHKIITEDFNCRPCGLKGCGNGMLSECIQAIQPQTVAQAALSLSKQ
jgi:heptosyltransferase-3